MKLSDFLLHNTKSCDFVIFKDGEYQIGCTWINPEDLFIQSLNQNMLERTVANVDIEYDPYSHNNRVVNVHLA